MRESGLYVDLAPWQCHLFEAMAPSAMPSSTPGRNRKRPSVPR